MVYFIWLFAMLSPTICVDCSEKIDIIKDGHTDIYSLVNSDKIVLADKDGKMLFETRIGKSGHEFYLQLTPIKPLCFPKTQNVTILMADGTKLPQMVAGTDECQKSILLSYGGIHNKQADLLKLLNVKVERILFSSESYRYNVLLKEEHSARILKVFDCLMSWEN